MDGPGAALLVSTLGMGWTVVAVMLFLAMGGVLELGAWFGPVQVAFALGIGGFMAWVVTQKSRTST